MPFTDPKNYNHQCHSWCSTPDKTEQTGCTIAVKAEHQNPGGSVKDRTTLYLIKEAEKEGNG